jgi:membrane protein YqaA with SNARE-associated domain
MKKIAYIVLVVVLTIVLGASILYLGKYITVNDAARSIVESFGVFGMVAVGIVTGFNLLVPVHAASFTQIFLSAGFSLPVIIVTLATGRMIADVLAYQLARWGKESTHHHFPLFYNKLDSFRKKHHRLIIPGIFLYAVFAPLPNETILIPLGLMGYHLSGFFIPLLLGTLINQILYTVGFMSLFSLFF